MKLIGILTLSLYATTTMAIEKDNFNQTEAVLNKEKDEIISKLTNTLAYQQRSYEEKINYLEIELNKTKQKLLEKSLNQDKLEAFYENKLKEEKTKAKTEVANIQRSLYEAQRQIEKMEPSEDLKKLVVLNTELSADLRKTEGHMAIIQLENRKLTDTTSTKNIKIKAVSDRENARMPASIKDQ